MIFNITGSEINVQGLGLGSAQEPIKFPSGLIPSNQNGSSLDAFLIICNATFGFNNTPHKFSTSWVPRGVMATIHGASGNLPPIGAIMGFTIGSFLVSGAIIHADYRTGAQQGTTVSIEIEDIRRSLDRIKIHTEDMGRNPASGVISIARGYRLTHGLYNTLGQVDKDLYFEYTNIHENGCTYPQIIEAITRAVSDGEIQFDITTIPSIADLEANIGGTASAIRFQFNMTPLSEVVSRVCEDTAYDWYWGMAESKVKLVTRKLAFDLNESDLFGIISSLGSASGIDQTVTLGFGRDMVQDPRKLRLLGGHQEGFINSELLSPIDGLDTPGSGVVFYPAWRDITVSFYDAGGFMRTYRPTDRELKIALNGIETWTYFKIYQTLPESQGGFNLPPDAGSTAAQHPDFQSRLDPQQPLADIGGNASGNFRLIDNRRDIASNWVLDFFNRIQSHAGRHFGKSYVASGILVSNTSGAFRITQSAWCNLENQMQGQPISEAGGSGLFLPDYEINRLLGPVSPFKTEDNKISAYCKLPRGTVYGPKGEDTPAGFADWTEDAPPFNPNGDGSHYIPIKLTQVGQIVIDPRNSDLYSFEEYPDGTILCQLPTIASSGLAPDSVLVNLVTLVQNSLDAASSGLFDVDNLSLLVQPLPFLSGVAIPVISPTRYGDRFPNQWVSGNLQIPCDSETVVVDDRFVPWNFPPQGNDTSLKIMNDRAFRLIQGAFVKSATSQFAQVEQVGLPEIQFDSFALQAPDVSGNIGTRTHGVTDLSMAFGVEGFTTSYKIASFHSELGREAPLGRFNRAILNGIINPIDFTDFNLTNNLTPERSAKELLLPQPPIFINTNRAQRTEKVTITDVNNALTFTTTPSPGTQERYRGITTQLYELPARGSATVDSVEGVICVDGFLNIGDEAVFHNETYTLPGNTIVQRYFTGGRSFSNATIVFVSGIGTTGSVFDVAIESTNPLRKLADVPVLNGSVSVGIRTTLATQAGTAPRILARPTAALTQDGVFINPGGVSVIPSIITSISAPGTSGALVTVKTLDASGLLDTTSSATPAVIPLPVPQFVQLNDKGFLVTTTVNDPATGTSVSKSFFLGARQGFIRFT